MSQVRKRWAKSFRRDDHKISQQAIRGATVNYYL
jgi:hypothetical protein